MQTLSRKMTIALVATFLFSFLFSIVGYTKSAQQYFSFSTLIFTIVVLSAPMFLIIGTISSSVVGKFIEREWLKFVSYLCIGAVLILPYTMYIFHGLSIRFMLIGAFGAVLYYAVQRLFERYLFKA